MKPPLLITFIFCHLFGVAQHTALNNNLKSVSVTENQKRTQIYNQAYAKISALELEERQKENERLRILFKENCTQNNALYLADLEKLNNLLQYEEIEYFEQFHFHFLKFYGNSIAFPKTDTANGFRSYDIFCLPDTFSIYNYPNLKRASLDGQIIIEYITAAQIEPMPADVSKNSKATADELEMLIFRILSVLNQKYPDKGFESTTYRDKEEALNLTTLEETINYRTNVISKFLKLL